MKNYYVNDRAQANGDHEVHVDSCYYLPSPINQKHLGTFGTCADAVIAAKKYYAQVNGCVTCCPSCHTQ